MNQQYFCTIMEQNTYFALFSVNKIWVIKVQANR